VSADDQAVRLPLWGLDLLYAELAAAYHEGHALVVVFQGSGRDDSGPYLLVRLLSGDDVADDEEDDEEP
jgi:hypothetical protein